MTSSGDEKLPLRALIGLVIGSMVGSGIFALPSAFAGATGGLGALIAWCIAGGGMLMLALVFQTLSRRKPELDAGIYAYARAGFGNYLGFASVAGYWIGCCLADVACLVLIKATLGQFFPIFGDGSTAAAIAGASIILWAVHFTILRGIRQAAALNTIATVAKILAILIFIAAAAVAFRFDVFMASFWGGQEPGFAAVATQVRGTMLITVFVFVGVEGASVYSRYARNRNDVGTATVWGFASVLSLLVLVTMLSYGVLLQPELAALGTPSVAGVMEAIVGPWGAVFISVGLLISVLGNYLSWSLLAAEVLHAAALNRTMPSFLAAENENKVASAALWMTNIVIQSFLLVTWFAEYAFSLALKMTGAVTLIPYLLVAAYGFKLAWTGETYADAQRSRYADCARGAIATLYAGSMILAGGPKFLLLSALLYAPGTILFVMARSERRVPVFTRWEGVVFGGIAIAALAGVYGLVSRSISI